MEPKTTRKDNSVFVGSIILSLIVVVYGILRNDVFGAQITALFGQICEKFNWFWVLLLTGYIFFMVYLALSRFGKVRLGPDDSRPEFSNFSWLGMLFSAGMGSGLVFFGVAEPVYHFLNCPVFESGSSEAATWAMQMSFMHWGLHPWATYGVTALGIGYFCMRKGNPILFSTFFEPVLRGKASAPFWEKSIDIWIVFLTCIGIAAPLGIAASQMSSGISKVFGLPDTFAVACGALAIIGVLYTYTAVTGVKKGIKFVADLNITLVGIICFFILIAGPTLKEIQIYVTSLGAYLAGFMDKSIQLSPFNADFDGWQRGWTILYWAWWNSWGPLCGVFFARISRGRTIRELVMAILVVPSLGSFAWMTIFGGTGITQLMADPGNALGVVVNENMSMALFEFLGNLPFSSIMSTLALCLIATFLITSANSGTFVLGMLSSNGDQNPSKGRLLTWGILMTVIAAVVLKAGDFRGLQYTAASAAFPYAIATVFMAYSLYKALVEEETERTDTATASQTTTEETPAWVAARK